jgi:hypothetical protein
MLCKLLRCIFRVPKLGLLLVRTMLGHNIGRILSTSAGSGNIAGGFDLELDSGHLDVVNAYEQPSCERESQWFCSRGRYICSERVCLLQE